MGGGGLDGGLVDFVLPPLPPIAGRTDRQGPGSRIVSANHTRIVGGLAPPRRRPVPSTSSTARRAPGGSMGSAPRMPGSHPGARGKRQPRISTPPKPKPDPRPWRKPPEGFERIKQQQAALGPARPAMKMGDKASAAWIRKAPLDKEAQRKAERMRAYNEKINDPEAIAKRKEEADKFRKIAQQQKEAEAKRIAEVEAKRAAREKEEDAKREAKIAARKEQWREHLKLNKAESSMPSPPLNPEIMAETNKRLKMARRKERQLMLEAEDKEDELEQRKREARMRRKKLQEVRAAHEAEMGVTSPSKHPEGDDWPSNKPRGGRQLPGGERNLKGGKARHPINHDALTGAVPPQRGKEKKLRDGEAEAGRKERELKAANRAILEQIVSPLPEFNVPDSKRTKAHSKARNAEAEAAVGLKKGAGPSKKNPKMVERGCSPVGFPDESMAAATAEAAGSLFGSEKMETMPPNELSATITPSRAGFQPADANADFMEQEAAATKIQAAHRGRQARKSYMQMQREAAELAEREMAATKIQAVHRGRVGRRRAAQQAEEEAEKAKAAKLEEAKRMREELGVRGNGGNGQAKPRKKQQGTPAGPMSAAAKDIAKYGAPPSSLANMKREDGEGASSLAARATAAKDAAAKAAAEAAALEAEALAAEAAEEEERVEAAKAAKAAEAVKASKASKQAVTAAAFGAAATGGAAAAAAISSSPEFGTASPEPEEAPFEETVVSEGADQGDDYEDEFEDEDNAEGEGELVVKEHEEDPEEVAAAREAAAVKIQAMHRGRKGRAVAAEKRVERRRTAEAAAEAPAIGSESEPEEEVEDEFSDDFEDDFEDDDDTEGDGEPAVKGGDREGTMGTSDAFAQNAAAVELEKGSLVEGGDQEELEPESAMPPPPALDSDSDSDDASIMRQVLPNSELAGATSAPQQPLDVDASEDGFLEEELEEDIDLPDEIDDVDELPAELGESVEEMGDERDWAASELDGGAGQKVGGSADAAPVPEDRSARVSEALSDALSEGLMGLDETMEMPNESKQARPSVKEARNSSSSTKPSAPTQAPVPASDDGYSDDEFDDEFDSNESLDLPE